MADNDGAASDYFGWSVAIAADCSSVLIGAYLDDDGFSDTGSAYLFKYQ